MNQDSAAAVAVLFCTAGLNVRACQHVTELPLQTYYIQCCSAIFIEYWWVWSSPVSEGVIVYVILSSHVTNLCTVFYEMCSGIYFLYPQSNETSHTKAWSLISNMANITFSLPLFHIPYREPNQNVWLELDYFTLALLGETKSCVNIATSEDYITSSCDLVWFWFEYIPP